MPRLLRHLILLALFGLGGCAGLPPFGTANPGAADLDQEGREALRLAHVLRDNGRMTGAYEVYQRMDQRQQLSGTYLLEYASVAALVRPAQETLTLYGRARQQLGGDLQRIEPLQRLALCSGSGRARLALGQAGQAGQAERDFRCALDADPRNPQALNGLGVALNLLGRDAEARQHFEKALEIDPGYSAAVNNLALGWLAGGDNARAIGLLNQSRNSGDVALQLNLALAYVLTGEDETARQVLAERLQPRYAERILGEFQAARQRIARGAPLASELLAVSQQPLILNEQD